MENSQYFALTIVLLISFVIFLTIVFCIISIKRHVRRKSIKNSKAPYTAIGYGMNRMARDTVEQNVDATCTVYVEPKVFTEEYENNWDDYLSRADVSFLYRLKVVDMYKSNEDLWNLITNSNNSHQFSDQSKNLINNIVELYKSARYSYKPFTKDHFEKFSELKDLVYEMVTGSRDVQNLDINNLEISGTSTSKKKLSITKYNSKKGVLVKDSLCPQTCLKQDIQMTLINSSPRNKEQIPLIPRSNLEVEKHVDKGDRVVRRLSVESIDSMTALIDEHDKEGVHRDLDEHGDDDQHCINRGNIQIGYCNQGIHHRLSKINTDV